jgi:hypothetical protein
MNDRNFGKNKKTYAPSSFQTYSVGLQFKYFFSVPYGLNDYAAW